MTTARLQRLAALLERSVVVLALAALAFRATLYGSLPRTAGAAYGSADVVDFALALLLFALCTACGGVGVMLSLRASSDRERGMSFRPALVGMSTFVIYYLLHPLVPSLAPVTTP
ncbi:MAG: hypothetical protein H6977_13580 [Gammaproteobacteria bacterium]|nr:hypothetical protein [Gammaproteobacteria bacterium]MCP5201041.1 hypothetical protein [Gammaproteobacteria bacterium]